MDNKTHEKCGVCAFIPLRPSTQGPWGLLTEGYARYGEVFTVPVAHKRITFLIGPDVSPHFFKASDDEMSQTEVRAARPSGTAQIWPETF